MTRAIHEYRETTSDYRVSCATLPIRSGEGRERAAYEDMGGPNHCR